MQHSASATHQEYYLMRLIVQGNMGAMDDANCEGSADQADYNDSATSQSCSFHKFTAAGSECQVAFKTLRNAGKEANVDGHSMQVATSKVSGSQLEATVEHLHIVAFNNHHCVLGSCNRGIAALSHWQHQPWQGPPRSSRNTCMHQAHQLACT